MVDLLFLPSQAFLFDSALQVRIVNDKDGVANVEHSAFFGNDASNASVFATVDLDGHDGLNESFDIDILAEVIVLDFAYLNIIGIGMYRCRAEKGYNIINKECQENSSEGDVILVAYVPRAFS